MWKRLRVAVLLLVLICVALGAFSDRFLKANWKRPIYVTAYALNADGSAASAQFVASLKAEDFAPLEAFFTEEAHQYGITVERPVQVIIGDPVRELPPKLDPGTNAFGAILWSLRARYWAWHVSHQKSGPSPTVRLFLLYHDPQRFSSLPHSIGLQKGMFGVVNVFADQTMSGSNLVVTAHELLHTVGATDKYDMTTNQPRLPDGYAEPDQQPLYPQRYAELMAGRIPVSRTEARTPESLDSVVVGPLTASEIGWRKSP
jgi:hypothetical protein